MKKQGERVALLFHSWIKPVVDASLRGAGI
jgi:hypothetical protein